MTFRRYSILAALVLTTVAFISCAYVATSAPHTPMPPATTPGDNRPLTPSAPPIAGTPVPRSAIARTFDEPLSSGLSVADVVENALPSVVHIIAGSGAGTGFIVNENGLVVTNKHVVEGASEVTLRLGSGGNFRGRVFQLHSSLDLAYIEIDAERTFTPIAIGDSDDIRVGEEVVAIGFPLGQSLGSEPTVSVGIISAKRDQYLQTDASLNPGNSGGPLLNMFGQATGVVTSRVDTTPTGRAVSGIGFAIPINEVRSGLGRQVSPSGRVLPTPTPFPAIGPTPDLEATKAAIEAADAYRRGSERATPGPPLRFSRRPSGTPPLLRPPVLPNCPHRLPRRCRRLRLCPRLRPLRPPLRRRSRRQLPCPPRRPTLRFTARSGSPWCLTG